MAGPTLSSKYIRCTGFANIDNDIVLEFEDGARLSFQDIIGTIESLQKRIKELEDTIVENSLLGNNCSNNGCGLCRQD